MRELLRRFWGKGSLDVGFEVRLHEFKAGFEDATITITPTRGSSCVGNKVTLKWKDSENPIEDILLYYLDRKPLPDSKEKDKLVTDKDGKKYRLVEVQEEEEG